MYIRARTVLPGSFRAMMAFVGTAQTGVVVVVHGLWTGCWAMAWLDRCLAAEGLRVVRFGYPSVRASLDANAAALARFARALRGAPVHWLGHSLGGILILRALMNEMNDNGGRVVMLGSPLCGSFAATRLARLGVGRTLLGRSVLDWLAAPAAAWTVPRELGVIAGTRSVGLGRLVAPDLPQPNDGAICVAETRIAGATEFLALPVSHSGMLLSTRVAREAAGFLCGGKFPSGVIAA